MTQGRRKEGNMRAVLVNYIVRKKRQAEKE